MMLSVLYGVAATADSESSAVERIAKIFMLAPNA
jgi:hypothetical protein